jgi:hypothetical protein
MFSCSECGGELTHLGTDRSFVCPRHGHPLATVEMHSLWQGEIVQIVEPTQHNANRFVVHFPGGKQRTIRYEHLRVFAMDHVLPRPNRL